MQLKYDKKSYNDRFTGVKEHETVFKGRRHRFTSLCKFFKSPIGGSWEDNEIAGLFKCPSENLIELFQSTYTDFLLVYFSGHGQQGLKETNIAIYNSESLSVSQLVSIIKAPKALIIIDTCRKSIVEEYSSFSGPEYLSFESTLNQPNSSEKYLQIISESTDGICIAYSCSVGEISNDTEVGGDYTYSLLKTSLEWYENQNSESILSINGANDLAHQYLKFKSNFDQNPQVVITNDKEENLNFPFAIKLNSL
jgi:hypothetical protein